MTSNSKISKSQKAELKDFKRKNPDIGFGQFGRMTVLVNRTSATMGEFTTAVASPDEQKLRPKVGEYHAMTRFQHSMAQPVFIGYWGTDELAEHLAMNLSEGF